MTMRTAVTKAIQMGGKAFSEATNIDTDAEIVHDVSIPAAEPGILTTRTDADTGVVTADVGAGHGITDTDFVDLYWDGGSRRGMDVTGVSSAEISIDVGSGDDLPTQDTVVAIVIPTELSVIVLGTNVKAIALYTQSRGQFVFEDVGGEEMFQRLGDGVAWNWHESNGSVNPITGDSIIIVKVSHDDTTQAQIMRVGVAYDN